jgi:hypothetical protein
MELLQFIFFSGSFLLLNWNVFLNLVYVYIYIKLTYIKFPTLISNNDPILIVSDFINMILHIIVNSILVLFIYFKDYKIFNSIILRYNNYNTIYINYKKKLLLKIISYPTKIIIKKILYKKFIPKIIIKPLINKPKPLINKPKPLINKPKLNLTSDLNNDKDIIIFLKSLSY